jgi:hypothetical protein
MRPSEYPRFLLAGIAVAWAMDAWAAQSTQCVDR